MSLEQLTADLNATDDSALGWQFVNWAVGHADQLPMVLQAAAP